MRHLLDTHAFIWFVLNDSHLSATATSLINDPANDIFISPATYWEMAIKVRLGKLDLHASYDDFMQRGVVGNDFEILPIYPRHTSVLTALPLHHRDPFDRLLIAQATVEAIPIISGDAIFDAYGIRRLW
jgi:PIN domain nuclease of toxin-antitoxin system